jgi:hypothetical protein
MTLAWPLQNASLFRKCSPRDPRLSLDLDQLLADLGTSPDDVAASLSARGVKGVANATGELNIIVRYVQSRMTEDALTVDVLRPNVLRVSFDTQNAVEATLPKPVVDFLDAFDHGTYPDLELIP